MHDADGTQVGQADVAGASLYYEVAGRGPWLVLVHAGVADRTMWDAQVGVFAERYRMLRYDLRGFGRSTVPAGPFSHCQDLSALFEALGIERAHLVGCSQGGATVLDFALEHPEKAASLVLVSSAVGGYEFKGRPPQPVLELMEALEGQDLTRAADLAVRIWADGPERTPEAVNADVRERVREMSLSALRNQLPGAAHEQGLEPPAIGRLNELATPTLVVVGDKDDASILDIGAVLAGGIAGAERITVPGAARMLPMEKPGAFNPAVFEFLRRVETASEA